MFPASLMLVYVLSSDPIIHNMNSAAWSLNWHYWLLSTTPANLYTESVTTRIVLSGHPGLCASYWAYQHIPNSVPFCTQFLPPHRCLSRTFIRHPLSCSKDSSPGESSLSSPTLSLESSQLTSCAILLCIHVLTCLPRVSPTRVEALWWQGLCLYSQCLQ